MDFMKTTSLRALIELTFQRKWNGLIWMNIKGVIAKIAKTGPSGSIEKWRPSRAERPAEERMFRGRPKSKPSVQASSEHTYRPGKQCPAVGQVTIIQDDAAHDHAAGKQRLVAVRLVSRTMADRAVRSGKPRPTLDQETSAKPFIRPTTKPIGHDRSDRADSDHDPIIRPIVPTDCPNAAVDPKPFLKPDLHNSSPMPAPTYQD
ncbi:unnamed protein product [Microthlaspi erraticum]|uniref:Uncharacterized protein n=1 Tax=Microthlaspi erraticum TaxID=1685480 RepID=A0A6D2KDN5_9BRAS|nr:unnamed protein product [Microthlaspi erraticum]